MVRMNRARNSLENSFTADADKPTKGTKRGGDIFHAKPQRREEEL